MNGCEFVGWNRMLPHFDASENRIKNLFLQEAGVEPSNKRICVFESIQSSVETK
jgi:hypothetical protein